jgi:DNA-binding response OmpR family regulator
VQGQGYVSNADHTRVKTILVVEDDADIGDFIVQVLTQETPHHPILVADGKQAFDVTRKLIPDLFIIDYLLPHMNGIELYDILQSRKELAAIPTIIISAHLPRQEIIKRKIIGFKKPFELHELLDTIQETFVS